MPKGFALVHVRYMNLDDWMIEGVERVENCDGSMRECCRIYDDACRDLARFVNPIDDFILAVTLVEANFEPELFSGSPAVRLHVGQRLVPVDMRLALTQKIEVGAVEDKNQATHCLRFLSIQCFRMSLLVAAPEPRRLAGARRPAQDFLPVRAGRLTSPATSSRRTGCLRRSRETWAESGSSISCRAFPARHSSGSFR